jgi:hypothetical protein
LSKACCGLPPAKWEWSCTKHFVFAFIAYSLRKLIRPSHRLRLQSLQREVAVPRCCCRLGGCFVTVLHGAHVSLSGSSQCFVLHGCCVCSCVVVPYSWSLIQLDSTGALLACLCMHVCCVCSCVVCQCKFEGEEVLKLLPSCGHAYHEECIDQWLAGSKVSQRLCQNSAASSYAATEPSIGCSQHGSL